MLVGAPPEQVEGMHHHPMWPLWEAAAPSLAYDHIADMGEDASVPVEPAANITVPTLVMNGSQSFPFMYTTAKELAHVIPNAQHQTLDGQMHEVDLKSTGSCSDRIL